MPVDPPVDHAAVLREHGLQVTALRLAVLQAVSGRPHSTSADIGLVARSAIGAVSLQAVYNALATLTEKGILRRFEPAGSPARYEDRVGDSHHHLICRSCSRIVDVDCAVGRGPCLAAGDSAGYEVDEAEVIYWGRCAACRVLPLVGAARGDTEGQHADATESGAKSNHRTTTTETVGGMAWPTPSAKPRIP